MAYKTFAEVKAETDAKRAAAKAAAAPAKAAAQAKRDAKRLSQCAKLAGFTINHDSATFSTRGSTVELPLAGAHAELINGDASERFTMTRFALAGPLALAMPKKSGHRNIIITTATGQQVSSAVKPENTQSAIRFMAEFNSVAAAAL